MNIDITNLKCKQCKYLIKTTLKESNTIKEFFYNHKCQKADDLLDWYSRIQINALKQNCKEFSQ